MGADMGGFCNTGGKRQRAGLDFGQDEGRTGERIMVAASIARLSLRLLGLRRLLFASECGAAINFPGSAEPVDKARPHSARPDVETNPPGVLKALHEKAM